MKYIVRHAALVLLVSGQVACHADSSVGYDLERSGLEEQALVTSAEYNPDNVQSLKGIYVWGEGVEVFTPCGEKKSYWVFPASEEMWDTLKNSNQDLATAPEGGLYIEVSGVLGPRLHPVIGGEYASDADGHVVIESLDAIRSTAEVDCNTPD